MFNLAVRAWIITYALFVIAISVGAGLLVHRQNEYQPKADEYLSISITEARLEDFPGRQCRVGYAGVMTMYSICDVVNTQPGIKFAYISLTASNYLGGLSVGFTEELGLNYGDLMIMWGAPKLERQSGRYAYLYWETSNMRRYATVKTPTGLLTPFSLISSVNLFPLLNPRPQ